MIHKHEKQGTNQEEVRMTEGPTKPPIHNRPTAFIEACTANSIRVSSDGVEIIISEELVIVHANGRKVEVRP